MSIKDLLKKYNGIEIEPLLTHVLGKPKEFLYMEGDSKLSANQLISLERIVKRREAGEPMAYILGYKDFCGLRFKVNKNVLIPRPETEWVIGRLVTGNGLQVTGRGAKILDLGTGSGCIAISLAKHLTPKTYNLKPNFYASDISPAALAIAKQNAKAHKVKIKFIRSDLFKNITEKFDVVIANLPYIPLKILHRHLLHKGKLPKDNPFSGLKYEPPFALTDGTSTWQIYKRFFQQLPAHLNPNCLILLEIDPSSRKFLNQYQKKYLPKAKLKFHKDFGNLWRYAEIKTC